MNRKISLLALLLTAALTPLSAQCLWTTAEVNHSITKSVAASAEAEMRSSDGLTDVERWSGSVGLSYRVAKPLKVGAGYTYIHQREPESASKAGGTIGEHWQPKHRVFAYATGEVALGGFTLSLQEQYRFTHRRGQYVTKFNDDGSVSGEKEHIEPQGKHILRSRLQVDYSIPGSNLTPYASAESYNRLDKKLEIDKTRYTVGFDYQFDGHHTVTIYYRYINKADEDDASKNVIGAGYTFKF